MSQDELRQEEEEREVAEVEMLLGAYYMNLDSTLNKLTDISEFVEDAEVISFFALLCKSRSHITPIHM